MFLYALRPKLKIYIMRSNFWPLTRAKLYPRVIGHNRNWMAQILFTISIASYAAFKLRRKSYYFFFLLCRLATFKTIFRLLQK